MLLNDDFSVLHTPKKGLKAHRDFLLKCLEENQEDFRRLLSDLVVEDPKMFLKMNIELAKLLLPKQQDVNVSLTLNQDFLELKALAESGSAQAHQIEGAQPHLLEYEELGPEPIESIETKIE